MIVTNGLRLCILAVAFAASTDGSDVSGDDTDRELAQKILSNQDMDRVMERGLSLFEDGFNAGSGYPEVWIRDLNTFIEMALRAREAKEIRECILTFFHFQGDDGNIIDGYVPKDRSSTGYKFRKSPTRPNLLGHKNTVETDQESSLIQAVCKYIKETGDREILREIVNGRSVEQRLEDAMDFVLNHRFDEKHGLLWGATTVDWGDVQPEHSWGVEIDENTHPAIDVYDNAMFIIAINQYLEVISDNHINYNKWRLFAKDLGESTMKHLWDKERHKFRPHIYLNGSPWPDDFDEHRIYYHGGTAAAMEAGLLSREQIQLALNDMLNNKRFSGAATVGIVNWPPYPAGYFENKAMVPYGYQNAGDWTWWGGRIVQQLVAHGFVEEAYRELLPMLERVEKNSGFYEWYTVKNEPCGSGRFRGSAGVLGKAILMLRQWAKDRLAGSPDAVPQKPTRTATQTQ